MYLVFLIVSGFFVFLEVGLLDDRFGSVFVFVLSSFFVLCVWIFLYVWSIFILSSEDDEAEVSVVVVDNE